MLCTDSFSKGSAIIRIPIILSFISCLHVQTMANGSSAEQVQELQEELRALQVEHNELVERSDEASSNYEQAIAAKDDAIEQLQSALQRIQACGICLSSH